ncbi:hypothetical protein KAX08_07565 [candidate division WOR-3 bacterium]|nr:hypothetical protein [candidate division WOR-3 bacterium]
MSESANELVSESVNWLMGIWVNNFPDIPIYSYTHLLNYLLDYILKYNKII